MSQPSIMNIGLKITYLKFHSGLPEANELKVPWGFPRPCLVINYGTNNWWFPLARKWPTWKWTWIWIPHGKIEKKCPRYFRRDSHGNPRDLNMCRTGRSAALSRGCKSMPPIGIHMKRVHETGRATAQIYVKAQWHEWVDTMSLQ